jgi:flagellin-like hook-associated protein FlgL
MPLRTFNNLNSQFAQNHLITNNDNLGMNIDNLTAAASTLRDAYVAEKVPGLIKQLLLVQTSSVIEG